MDRYLIATIRHTGSVSRRLHLTLASSLRLGSVYLFNAVDFIDSATSSYVILLENSAAAAADCARRLDRSG